MEIEEVYTRLVEIRRVVLSPRRGISPTFGVHKSRFKGIGFEFAGIEEWRPGEPLSNIAWRMSLRYLPDRIFKIRRKEPKQMPTDLVIDLTPSMRFQIKEGLSKARLLFELIGAVGFTSVRKRDPVGAVGFSDDIELFLKPKTSGKHILHIVRKVFERINLLDGQNFKSQSGGGSTADMNAPLNFLYRKYKTRRLIVVLSDFVDIINNPHSIDWELWRAAASKHDIIALILYDPDEFKWDQTSGTVTIRNPETGRRELIKGSRGLNIREEISRKMQNLIVQLKQNGVDALAVSYENHRADLFRFFRGRKRIFR